MKTFLRFVTLGMTAVLTVIFTPVSAQTYPYELPKLPFAYNALEPVIDAQTMEIHFSKHHANYVKNLNAAVKGTEYEKYSLDELMLYASENGDAVRNNAGGHYNHSLYWNTLSLNSPFDIQSAVGKAIAATFGSADSLKKLLTKAGASRFGSGWVWLYVTPEKKLAVCSSPNQNNPIMDVSPDRGIPVLAIDVWEHAYYLKYQNKRGDYLAAVLTAINWDAVNKNYSAALASPLLKTIELDTWKGLNDFHEVMGRTFHPSEKGDLKPIREQSGELLARARDLQAGKIPASFNTPEIRKSIENLVKGANSLHQLILKKSDDKVIIKKLAELHDIFHSIR